MSRELFSEDDEIISLAHVAWASLITAQPNSNPAVLAVRALNLAKAMKKVQDDFFAIQADREFDEGDA